MCQYSNNREVGGVFISFLNNGAGHHIAFLEVNKEAPCTELKAR